MKKKGKKGKRISPLGYLFRAALAVSATALLLSYVSIFINPAKIWILSLFGLYYIPIVAVNVVLLTMAVVRLSASAWLPIIVLLPSLFFLRHFFNFHPENKPYMEGTYKVATYNVGKYTSDNMDISRQECQRQISSFIREENPDIVCFQEYYTAHPSRIATLLPDYPHKHYHLIKGGKDFYFGNLIVSKKPIVSQGKITFENSTNLSIYADVKFGDETVRVYNNHLESYSLSPTAIIKRLRNGTHTISDELKAVHEKMRTSNIRRADQVDKVLKHIQNSQYPSIICGDLNDTPMSYTYQKLRRVSKDTFLEAGRGFSSTYSFLWPLLRIDYILVPESYEVAKHTTPRIGYSDHYPVITEIHRQI